MSRRSSRTVYVGNLPGDIREREVEDLFMKVISDLFFFHFDLKYISLVRVLVLGLKCWAIC